MKIVELNIVGPAEIRVDWGDGSDPQDVLFSEIGETRVQHAYTVDGTYDISVTGQAVEVRVSNVGLIEVKNFGTLSCSKYQFDGCVNLTKVPTTLPSTVRSLADKFKNCSNFNDVSVSNWDTANVTDFSGVFEGTSFNQALNWNTAKGTTFARFAKNATAFNQSINSFNFGLATDLSSFLQGATSFNQPVSISAPKCTTVMSMLNGARAFNSALSMQNMTVCTDWSFFLAAATAFNQPIDGVDILAATNLTYFLAGATVFDQDLTTLDVEHIPSEPTDFSTGTAMTPEKQPLWGQPPAVPVIPGPAEPTEFVMMTDAQSGGDLMLQPVVFPNTLGYASPADAYAKWCADLSLDPTLNLNNSLLNDDDDAKLFNIPFIPTLTGTSTQMFHTTEGGFGIYKSTLPPVTVYNNSIIGATALSQQGIGSVWWPTANPPALLIGSKLPTADYMSMDAKHNATANTAVFYCKYHQWNDPTFGEVEIAILLRKGKMTIVAGNSVYDTSAPLNEHTYVNVYTLNEGGTSKIATSTNGGVAQAVPNDGSTIILSSISTTELQNLAATDVP